MTVKRISHPGTKTKLLHEETKLAFWVGYRDTHIGLDRSQASTGYVNSTKEDFEALIELAQAAIRELDDVKAKKIAEVEAELKALKGESE